MKPMASPMTKPFAALTLFAVLMVVWLAAPASGQFRPSTAVRTPPDQMPLSRGQPPGSVSTGQATTAPNAGVGVNTLNSTIQIQGIFQGSTPAGVATKEPLSLSLDEAIKRGIAYN